MTKRCPNCGKEIPDESNYCLECGCHIYNKPNASKSSGLDIISNGKIFLALIFIVLIIGGILIFTMSGNADKPTENVNKDADEFSLNIQDISAYDSTYDGKTSYTYYLEVLFNKVPSNKGEYIVKTIYLDENDTELGSETQSLDSAYSDSKYGTYVGYYTSYKYIDVDHAKLQIIKDNNVIKEYSAKLDKNKLKFDKPQNDNKTNKGD